MPSKHEVRVAKETVVIVVGARPVEYGKITVKNRRTGLEETIPDTDNPPIDEGDLGVSYAFKEGQPVRADHPAVLDAPGAFREVLPSDGLVYGRDFSHPVEGATG